MNDPVLKLTVPRSDFTSAGRHPKMATADLFRFVARARRVPGGDDDQELAWRYIPTLTRC